MNTYSTQHTQVKADIINIFQGKTTTERRNQFLLQYARIKELLTLILARSMGKEMRIAGLDVGLGLPCCTLNEVVPP